MKQTHRTLFLSLTLVFSLSVVTSLSARAEFFGYWKAGLVKKIAKNEYQVNDFKFVVKDAKTAKFIRCAIKKYPVEWLID